MYQLSGVAAYESEGCCAEEEVIPAFSLDQLRFPLLVSSSTRGSDGPV